MKAFRWRDFLSLPVGKNLCFHDGHVTVVAAGASVVASCSLFVLLDDG